jgi:hypothetical protein
VVRVVEEQPVPAHDCVVSPDRLDQRAIIPFVHQHEVGAVEHAVEIEVAQGIRGAPERRKDPMESGDGLRTVVGHQIGPAPAIGRLEDCCPVPPRLQLGDHTPEKVRVPVVPVGHEGVAEHYDAHACTSVESRR